MAARSNHTFLQAIMIAEVYYHCSISVSGSSELGDDQANELGSRNRARGPETGRDMAFGRMRRAP